VGLCFELRASCWHSRVSTTWVTSLVHFVLVILDMGSCELFAWAGLEPWSNHSLLSRGYWHEPLVPGFKKFFWFPSYFFDDPLAIQWCIVLWPFLLVMSSFILLWSDIIQRVILISLHLLRLILCPEILSLWRKFYGLLRRMCIMQLLNGIFCRCMLSHLQSFIYIVDLSLKFLCWVFVCMVNLVGIVGYWNLPLLLCWVYLCL
jgi:hypothetical protein